MNEQTAELASLYVLDLLEGEERRAFEKQMAADAELARTIDEFQSDLSLLAHDVPLRNPPPELEHRIFTSLRRKFSLRGVTVSHSWVPWAIAASLMAACFLLLIDRARISHQLAALQRRSMVAETQIAMLSSKLENAPRAYAVVVWDVEKQEGVLKVVDVPKNATDHDYQLWVVDPEYKQPVSGAVFAVESDGTTKIAFKPEARVSSAKAFAVTLERKGGVPKAEGPMVLLSK